MSLTGSKPTLRGAPATKATVDGDPGWELREPQAGAEGAPGGGVSIKFTFHEDAQNVSKGRGCRSKGTDREEERADGVSHLVLRLQRK